VVGYVSGSTAEEIEALAQAVAGKGCAALVKFIGRGAGSEEISASRRN
jgi:hypothetical protein